LSVAEKLATKFAGLVMATGGPLAASVVTVITFELPLVPTPL